MTTFTDSLGFNKNVAGYPAKPEAAVVRIDMELDFAKIVAARSAAGVTALAAADVLEVLKLPANSVVLHAGFEVLTVDAGGGTVSLGYGGNTAIFTSASAVSAIANFGLSLAAPSVFLTADTIDVLINTALFTTLKIRVFAIVAACAKL